MNHLNPALRCPGNIRYGPDFISDYSVCYSARRFLRIALCDRSKREKSGFFCRRRLRRFPDTLGLEAKDVDERGSVPKNSKRLTCGHLI